MFSVDSQPESVLVAWRYLTAPKHALCASDETQEDMGVVIEGTVFHNCGQIRGQAFQFETGDKTKQQAALARGH